MAGVISSEFNLISISDAFFTLIDSEMSSEFGHVWIPDAS